MGRRVEDFKKDVVETPRRYPWAEWTDEAVWEISQGEDYDVATENMRVNLHEYARKRVGTVRTEKVTTSKGGEGLRFQFKFPNLPSPLIQPLAHRGIKR